MSQKKSAPAQRRPITSDLPADPRITLAEDARRALAESRWSDAESLCRKGLGFGTDAQLEELLGEAALNLGRHGEAAVCFARALAIAEKGSSVWVDAAGQRARLLLPQGQTEEAAELLKEVTHRRPEDVSFRRAYGVALRRLRDFAGVERELRAVVQILPDDIDAAVDLSWFLEEMSRQKEAFDLAVHYLERFGCEDRLVRLRAVIERRQGRHRELLHWLQERVKETPDSLIIWREMAHTVAALDGAKSVALYREVLKRAPHDYDAIVDLANRLQRTRGPDEAKFIEEAYHLALRALALVSKPKEKVKEIHEILTRVVDFDSLAKLGSFQTLCSDWARKGQAAALHPMMGQVVTPEDRIYLLKCHTMCGRQMDQHAAASPLPPRPAVTGRARIKLGFMSSDLRNHPVSYFVWPLLEKLDRSKFEVFCYSWSTSAPDQVQQMIAGHVDHFRREPVIGNRDAAALISNDNLDMLFELGGSTHMNKLDVMSWRPAPRQASWLGYPHSAGLETIDRLLVDPYLRPAFTNLILEKPFELAHSWVCFKQPGFGPLPEIAEKSAQDRNGFVTFGTMNNPYKFNPLLLRTWAQILKTTSNSRLLFVRPEGGTPAFRRNLSRFFESEGVDAKRLLFVPIRGTHMRHYNDMDISLDTFPQTGGTTTCETLFMGVPVVTLAGTAFYERLSYSNLMNSGLPDLVAYSRESYVAIAARLAQDKTWRDRFRKEARTQIANHPLGQPEVFARDFERAAVAWMDGD